MTTTDDQQSLKDEIVDLERRLRDAKSRLSANNTAVVAVSAASNSDAGSYQQHTITISFKLTQPQLSMHSCYSQTQLCHWDHLHSAAV